MDIQNTNLNEIVTTGWTKYLLLKGCYNCTNKPSSSSHTGTLLVFGAYPGTAQQGVQIYFDTATEGGAVMYYRTYWRSGSTIAYRSWQKVTSS